MTRSYRMLGEVRNGWKLVDMSMKTSSTGTRMLIVAHESEPNLLYTITKEQWEGKMARMNIAVSKTFVRSLYVNGSVYYKVYMPVLLASLPKSIWTPDLLVQIRNQGFLYRQIVPDAFRQAMLHGHKFMMNDYPKPDWAGQKVAVPTRAMSPIDRQRLKIQAGERRLIEMQAKLEALRAAELGLPVPEIAPAVPEPVTAPPVVPNQRDEAAQPVPLDDLPEYVHGPDLARQVEDRLRTVPKFEMDDSVGF